jgi:hypothetical protein
MEVAVMVVASVIHLVWIVWFAFRMNTIEDRVCKMRTQLTKCNDELTELRKSAQAIQKLITSATQNATVRSVKGEVVSDEQVAQARTQGEPRKAPRSTAPTWSVVGVDGSGEPIVRAIVADTAEEARAAIIFEGVEVRSVERLK